MVQRPPLFRTCPSGQDDPKIPAVSGRYGLKPALTFLLIGLIAALLGFTGVAGASFAIARVFALIFGVLFLLFLVLGLSAGNRPTT